MQQQRTSATTTPTPAELLRAEQRARHTHTSVWVPSPLPSSPPPFVNQLLCSSSQESLQGAKLQMELRLSRRQTRGKLRARIYRCFHFRLGAATSARMAVCVCINTCVCLTVYRGCFRFMLKQFHVKLALRGIKAVGLIIYKLAPRTDASHTHTNTSTYTRTWRAERRS